MNGIPSNDQQNTIFDFANYLLALGNPDIVPSAGVPNHKPVIWWKSLEGVSPPMDSENSPIVKYSIIRQLGGGGFGMVYLAMDHVLKRRVAIKVLTDSAANDPEVVKNFSNEIFAAASLEHSNIIRIYELGESDGRPYVTMEYIEGQDLRDAVLSVRQFNIAVLRTFFIQVCRALEFIHQHGFIHCDVKPENILINREGTAKITDFSLMQRVDDPTLNTSESLWGTPTYMAPEVIEGNRFDNRADIYSFGVMFYEMRTGSPPFEGSPNEILQQHLLVTPRAPSRKSSNIFPEEDRIILRCLEKNPENRYANATDLVNDIRKLDLTERYEQIHLRGPCSLKSKKFCDKNLETQRKLIPMINGTGLHSNIVFDEFADEIIRELEFNSVRLGENLDSDTDLCKSCQVTSSSRAVIANISSISANIALQIGLAFGNEKRVLLLRGNDAENTFFEGVFPTKNFGDRRDLRRVIRKFIMTHDEQIKKTAECFFRWEFHCKERPKPEKKRKKTFFAITTKDSNEEALMQKILIPGLSEITSNPIFLPNSPLNNFNSRQRIYDNFCAICKGAAHADSAVIDITGHHPHSYFILGLMFGSKRKILLIQRDDCPPKPLFNNFNVVNVAFFRDIIDAVHDYLL